MRLIWFGTAFKVPFVVFAIEFLVETPPGGIRRVIGCRTKASPETDRSRPRSLYWKQLRERLGSRAYEAVYVSEDHGN